MPPMKSFLVKQQLPDFKTALERAEGNLETWTMSKQPTASTSTSTSTSNGDSNTPAAKSTSASSSSSASASTSNSASPSACTCACPHLLELLPGQLNLDFCQTANRGWVLANPVHALHLSSQLDPSWLAGLKDAPIMYGEEQERTMAMQTPGLPETYHPFMKKAPVQPLPATATMKEAAGGASDLKRPLSRGSSSGAAATSLQSTRQPSVTPPEAVKPTPTVVPSTAPSSSVPLAGVGVSSGSGVSAGTGTVLTVTATTSVASLNAAANAGAGPITLTPPIVQTKPPFAATDPTQQAQEQAQPLADATTSAAAPFSLAKALAVPSAMFSSQPSIAHFTPATTPMETTKSTDDSASMDTAPVLNPPATTIMTTTTTPMETTKSADDSAITAPVLNAPAVTPMETIKSANDNASTAPVLNAPTTTSMDMTKTTDSASMDTTAPMPAKVPSAPILTSTASTGPQPPVPAPAPTSTATIAAPAPPAPTAVPYHSNFTLSDTRFWSLHAQEDQIRILRRSFMTKRLPAVKKKTDKSSKKRKASESKHPNLVQLSAWKPTLSVKMTPDQESAWEDRFRQAKIKVELWMEHFRLSRQAYWEEQRRSRQPAKLRSTFGSLEPEQRGICCQLCRMPQDRGWKCAQAGSSELSGDDLMKCLECSFVGCAPCSVAPKSSQHILQHLLLSNHKFAVTCGPKATVYCFKCGDFVYHDVFEQEKERVDLVTKLPSQAWKNHPIQRSFDALRFVHIQDEGVMWKGMYATYPPLVPQEHVLAARLCRQRQILFEGEVSELPLTALPNAKHFAALSNQNGKWRIRAPVGMYNLGNTCFQTAILQCLINCPPLQKFFLHDIGHHHLSCEAYRKAQTPTAAGGTSLPTNGGTDEASRKKSPEVCLACEMDKLFMGYLGNTIGVDVVSTISDTKRGNIGGTLGSGGESNGIAEMAKGEPIVTEGMLTATWKCGGMSHLAGYEQRDAHEFLHAFLENLGKHIRQYRERVYKKINAFVPTNAIVASDKSTEHDAIKTLFEGKLRSVLMCQECGNKRVQSEPFMSISLPLSKEVQKATNEMPGESNEHAGRVKVSVERCLRHFTIPEMLADPVDCPSCGNKTPTQKQHVVSKLPRVLCLHLKRFDAAQNKKIEDFVSFPAKGLNMGPHLPHWCEVTRIQSPDDSVSEPFTPEILFDLFGTVNHYGNLQSGHYVTNLKVGEKWFHCNDAHVCDAGIGDGEAEVLKSDGAYLLFYIRR